MTHKLNHVLTHFLKCKSSQIIRLLYAIRIIMRVFQISFFNDDKTNIKRCPTLYSNQCHVICLYIFMFFFCGLTNNWKASGQILKANKHTVKIKKTTLKQVRQCDALSLTDQLSGQINVGKAISCSRFW